MIKRIICIGQWCQSSKHRYGTLSDAIFSAISIVHLCIYLYGTIQANNYEL